MKKSCLLFLLLVINFINAYAQGWQWAKNGSCTNCGIEFGPVAADRYGNVYEAGTIVFNDAAHLQASFGSHTFTGTYPFFQGLLVSADPNGNYRWAIGTQATLSNTLFFNVAVDRYGYSYVVGQADLGSTTGTMTFGGKSFTGNYFCAKVTPGGSVLWVKDIAPGAEQITGLAVNNAGQFFAAGVFKGNSITIGASTLNNTDITGGTTDGFVAMYDSSGHALWAKKFGGTDSESVSFLAISPNNDVYVTGAYNSTSMTVGSSTLTNPGFAPFYIAKFSGSGVPLWAVTNLRDTIIVNSIAADKHGNAYITGLGGPTLVFGTDTLRNGGGFFLAAFDSSGNAKWGRTNTNSGMGFSVTADACGNIWVSSEYPNFTASSDDPVLLAEYDSAGHREDTLYLRSGSDDGWPYPQSNNDIGLAVDNKGNLYVGGDYAITPFIVGSTTLTIPDSISELSFLLKYKYATSFCVVDTAAQAPEIVNLRGVSLFPNPAHDELTIQSTDGSINEIAIANLIGQEVRGIQVTGKGGREVRVDVSGLPGGIYFVRINGTEVRKFVKN